MKRIVVGITGASGVIYGVRMLEILCKLGVETHLIITQAGLKNLEIETSDHINRLKSMASHVYEEGDFTASLASGSFKVDGMDCFSTSIPYPTSEYCRSFFSLVFILFSLNELNVSSSRWLGLRFTIIVTLAPPFL